MDINSIKIIIKDLIARVLMEVDIPKVLIIIKVLVTKGLIKTKALIKQEIMELGVIRVEIMEDGVIIQEEWVEILEPGATIKEWEG